jgi:uncharacterized protein
MQQDNSPDSLELRRDEINGIPILICSQDESRPKPLALLSHGFTGNKGFWSPHLRTLGGLGFFAVALDNRAHGTRHGASFHELAFDGNRLRLDVVRRLIKETADDIPGLIDHLVGWPGVDGSRIAMAGVSMGGYITFRAMVIDKRITVGAPVIASPFWDDIPRGVSIVEDDVNRLALAELDRAYSPARFPEAFAGRPLLIQIGGQDGHYDAVRVQSFYELLRAKYYRDNPEKVRFTIHDDVEHDFTPAMWSEALIWLKRYMLEDRPAR